VLKSIVDESSLNQCDLPNIIPLLVNKDERIRSRILCFRKCDMTLLSFELLFAVIQPHSCMVVNVSLQPTLSIPNPFLVTAIDKHQYL
jgi:hypothetical protein